LHDSIILLKGEIYAHQASLTPPLFIEMRVQIQESEWSYVCVWAIGVASFYSFCILFRIVPTMLFILLSTMKQKLPHDKISF
jgi:hypothetical protein